jgi:hypothetical protein
MSGAKGIRKHWGTGSVSLDQVTSWASISSGTFEFALGSRFLFGLFGSQFEQSIVHGIRGS